MMTLKAAAWLTMLGLVTLPVHLAAETYWEGSAARIRSGEIAQSGLFAASNTFPRDTRIRVTNRSSGQSEILTVVQRIDRATSVMVLVTAEAADKLGIGPNDVVPVRISVAGDQGLGVGARPTESPLSQDPDVNPSVRAPAQRPLPSSAVSQASPASKVVAASNAPEASGEAAEPDGQAEQAPGGTTEPSGEAASTSPVSATPAAVPARATAQAPVPTAPAVSDRQQDGTTAPAAEPAEPARPTPEDPVVVASARELPIELPATSPEAEREFLERVAARVPGRRVFAPARGSDVPEPVFADEAPLVLAEAAPPSSSVPVVQAASLDQPLVAAATAPAVRQQSPASEPAPVREAASVEAVSVAASEPSTPPPAGPFVQAERPSAASAAAEVRAMAPEAPEAPAERIERQDIAFVQSEKPQASTRPVASQVPSPTLEPREESRRERSEETAFVQNEQPRAEVPSPLTATHSPSTPPERVGAVETAFVQAERPIASGRPLDVESIAPPSGLSGFVQVEQVGALSTSLAHDPAAPGLPAEGPEAPGMVQVEQPQPETVAVAVGTLIPLREGAAEIMSAVDSPSATPAAPEIARVDAAVPRGEEGDRSGGGASTRTPDAPAGTGSQADFGRGPAVAAATPASASRSATVSTDAARPRAASTGAASPAALLAAAVAREGLPLDAYYLQVAAVESRKVADELVGRLGKSYPSWVIPPDAAEQSVYRVLVGPLTADERGAVLSQFRTGGFSDAFLRYLD